MVGLRPDSTSNPDVDPHPDASPPALLYLQRLGVIVICVAYITVTVYYSYRHTIGDTSQISESPTAYFFTWDMFPGYETATTRRTVVGLCVDRTGCGK